MIIKAGGKPTKAKAYGAGPIRKSDEITLFFEEVSNVLVKEIDDNRPSKTSRWAGVGEKYRYYHFWYDRSLWDNWDLSYKIWLFDESDRKAERRNKFGVFFEFYKKRLLGKGLTEEMLNKLIGFTKSVNIEGFKFYPIL